MNTTLQKAVWASIVASLSWTCSGEKEGATNVRGGGGSAAGTPPTAVVGTVGLEAGDAAGAGVEGRTVQLVDSDNVVVSEGTTTAAGAFTIALETAALRLAAGNASGRVLSLRTLFLNGEAQPSAVGIRRQIAIPQASATANFDVGTQTAKKVGAIVGRVTLETGADPTGIDVYVPGTTHIAKTDATGQFVLGFLPPGTYDLRADKDGFASHEWQDLVVAQSKTTHVGDTALKISTGPSVAAFALEQGGAVTFTTNVMLKIGLKGAAKYRVSQLNDFRDAVYRPLDVKVEEIKVPFVVSGRDGLQPIYLEAADNDGLVAKATLEVLLDTAPPSVPTYTMRSSLARDGYTNVTSPRLTVAHCDDVSKIFVTEDATKVPAQGDFPIECASALTGLDVSISAGDGAKEIRLWTLDAAGQVSKQSRAYVVRLDTVAPSLSVSPSDAAPFPAAIRITATTDLEAEVHYTTDLSTPTAASPAILGELALFNDATFKLKAIDNAGNESPIVERAYQIDRDGPILGTIAVADGDAIVASHEVDLVLSAVGATKMAFATSKEDLATATRVPYATTYRYSVPGSADGDYRIYVMFVDNAGNVIGENAELSAAVTIDTEPPSASLISLLVPSTPSGDFDKRLVWASTLEDVTYEVQVCSTATCSGSIVRPSAGFESAMSTTSKSLIVSPALPQPGGTYYWRVRAKDTAGNASDWVESGTALAFEVRILVEAYASTRSYEGRTSKPPTPASADHFFGHNAVGVGNWMGAVGGMPEIAFAVGEAAVLPPPSGATTPICHRCPFVSIRNLDTNEEIARATPPFPSAPPTNAPFEQSLFGRGMVSCDVIDGGFPELVVSAPARGVRHDNISYFGFGEVYVYQWNGSSLTLAATYSSTNLADKSYSYLSGSCTAASCGTPSNVSHPFTWMEPTFPFGVAAATNKSGLYSGWSLTCEPRGSGGGDRLWVGEPGYATNTTDQHGRMLRLSYSNNAFTVDGTLVGGANEGFAASALYLPSYEYGAACTGEVLAVGAPRKSGKGAVYLYEKSGDVWGACATIDADASDATNAGFGATLADLGDVSADVGNKTELAVGAVSIMNAAGCLGFVRIFGDASTTALKHAGSSCTGTTTMLGGFGSRIARLGDFDGDGGGDILVTAPLSRVNGLDRAGMAHVYRWADLGNGATVATTTPYKVVTGVPSSLGFFSAAAVTIPAVSGSYDDTARLTLFGRPGATPIGPGSPPPETCWTADLGAGPSALGCRGRVEEFSKSSLKFGDAVRIVGTTTNGAFGRSVRPSPDLDGDGLGELVIGQPGGRCNGLDWGSLLVLSGKDASEIRNICGPTADSSLGAFLGMMPSSAPASRFLSFSLVQEGSLRIVSRLAAPPDPTIPNSLLAAFDYTPLPGPVYDGIIDPNGGSPPAPYGIPAAGAHVSAVRTLGGSTKADYFSIAQRSAEGGLGTVHFVQVPGGGSNFHAHKFVLNGVAGTDFGASADVGAYLSSGAEPLYYNAIGAPKANRVYLCKHRVPGAETILTVTSPNCDNNDNAWATRIERAAGDATKFVLTRGGTPTEIASTTTILDGFGSLVVALPDLDGADVGMAKTFDSFLFVSNTNASLEGESTRQAQYFILAINLEGATPVGGDVKVLSTVTDAEVGTLLGAAAHIVPDIDADANAFPELVVASPKGLGTYGDTGHVRLISLAKLMTAPTTAVLQVIFNPDEGASNFGIAATRADVNGDGTHDLIVGADEFSGNGINGAGAAYIFPLEGVKR